MATRKKKQASGDTRGLWYARWPGAGQGPEEEEPEEGLERPPTRRFSVSISNWFLSPRVGVHNRWTVQRYPADAIASHWAEIEAGYEPER